ncbi:unnamed protein product [Rangifer tarandus platyrhynchus]|uniref:Uncharacterized protein n=1 Tax=Rangifer tarandus platyrhynchus TaxID=3082113 RepID=A0AC59ZG84_RANTA
MGATGLTQGPQIHACPSSSQLSFSKARIGQSPNLSSMACEELSLRCTFICSIYCRSGKADVCPVRRLTLGTDVGLGEKVKEGG